MVRYSFFGNLTPGTEFAFGSLTYDTRRGFTEASIQTTADPTCCRGQGNPGRLYNQVDLLGQADRPFELWAWDQSATGAVGDPVLFIDFIPLRLSSPHRLEVAFGVEGICQPTPSPNSCFLSQDRIIRLGSGRAFAVEVIPMPEPNTAVLFALGALPILIRVRRRPARKRR